MPLKRFIIHLTVASMTALVVASCTSNQDQVNSCIVAVSKAANARWARYCKLNAKREKMRLRNCIDEGEARNRLIYESSERLEFADKETLASCKNIYDDVNPDEDCLLPKALADSLNNGYEKEIEMCKS